MNTTEIHVKQEQDLVTNTTINLYNKSFFNSTEEINVEESNEDLMTNKTNSDNFTNVNNNNTTTKSSFPSSTTTMNITIEISPIDLASNDSLHNENNKEVTDLKTPTESVLSSTSLSSNESFFSSNGNHSKNLINHSLKSNHANSTSFIGSENISTINRTFISTTDSKNE